MTHKQAGSDNTCNVNGTVSPNRPLGSRRAAAPLKDSQYTTASRRVPPVLTQSQAFDKELFARIKALEDDSVLRGPLDHLIALETHQKRLTVLVDVLTTHLNGLARA